MKKFLKIMMLAVLSIACVVMATACTQDDNGSSDKGLLCKTIGGVYTVYDYVDDGRKETTLDIGKEIGEGFTEVRIKKGAFSGNNTIKEIIVPSVVKTIDEGAFAGMKALEKITLPFIGSSALADGTFGDSVGDKDKSADNARTFGYLFGADEYDGGSLITVTYNSGATESRYMPTSLSKVVLNATEGYKVPMYAFSGCVNLTDIELKGGISEIGEYAFSDCKNLNSISVPATVTNVRKGAFSNCTSLNETVLDGATALVEIGESAFMNAKLENVILNANAVIGKKAFSGSTVKSVTLKGQVNVGASAFANCTKLAKVNLDNVSNGVISQFAFQGATALKQFGGAQNTIDLTNFTVENLAFSDIFEDATKIAVVGVATEKVNDVFGW